jgi:N-acetylmuramoyl-L-alanine amidase
MVVTSRAPAVAGSEEARVHDIFPLRTGQVGDAVLDLQERLWSLSFSVGEDRPGEFGEATAIALKQFQESRGLHADGVCDSQTWGVLVEAGIPLGERLLYFRSPPMRGDDVAELQRRLSEIGFYSGAINAIYGEPTAAAVAEFQRNVGMTADGMFGKLTLAELARLSSRVGEGELVSTVLERLAIHRRTALKGACVVVGEEGGFAQGVAALCRALSAAGARAVDVHHPDSSRIAAEANNAGASVYVGLQLDPQSESCRTNYYRGFSYESLAGRKLAEMIQAELPGQLGLHDGGTRGMALPILRETRMPAVVVELGSPGIVVRRTAEMGQSLVSTLTNWMSTAGSDRS